MGRADMVGSMEARVEGVERDLLRNTIYIFYA